MYRRKYEALTDNDKKAIEQDIILTQLSSKQLADKYGCFEDVIDKIKKEDLGMLDDISEYTTNNNITAIPVIKLENHEVPVRAKATKGCRITEDVRQALKKELEEYVAKDWEGFSRKAILEKYQISNTSFDRICSKYSIIVPKGTDRKKKKIIIVSDSKEKDSTGNGLEPLEKYISSNMVAARMDENISINGVNYVVFPTNLQKNVNFDDYEQSVQAFFRKNIVGKSISLLKIYARPKFNYDPRVYVFLSKYCVLNQCNLTIVDGIKENNIISDYTKLNKNFQKLSACSVQTKKYLYNTKFSAIKNADTIFSVSVYDDSKKELIICDSYKKALDFIMQSESEKANKDIILKPNSKKMYINMIKDGNDVTLLYIESKF